MSKKLLLRFAVLVTAMMCALGAAAAEAYACYTSSNTTLTFYYDNQRSSRTGTTYNLNADDINPGWRSDGTNTSVTRVVFDPSFAVARPTTTYRWFNNMTGLTTISGLHYLNTSEVTNMQNMFSGSGLTSLDLSGFNTTNVTDMSYMFYNCSNLRSLDVSSFNTSNVTDMRTMFYGCSNLTSLDVSSFNTSSATTLTYMFCGCSSLTSLDVSCFNTSSAKNLSYMFRDCSGLTSLDLGSFNTSRATNMSYMFDGCSGLNTIYAGDGWNTAAVTSSANMFWNCSNIRGGKGTTYDANHIDKAYAHIDGGPSNPGYFTEKPKEAYACYTSDNTTLTFYYDNQRANRSGTTYDLNSGDALPQWYNDRTYESVTRVVFNPSFGEALPTSTCAWFMSMEHLQSITGLSYLNTSKVTYMTNMFYGCMLLTSLDLSGFNTAKVTDMSSMFYGCYVLQNPDLSGFNTANVTSMRHMFDCCHNITSLDLSHFNTANVTNMEWMFNGCIGLTSLDLGSFNTAKVTTMASMFRYCSSLTNLNVTGFNTQNVTDMQEMFCNCDIVTSLDLHSFNTARVTNMHWMFIRCGNLNQIYVGNNWSTAAVTNSEAMFYGCTNLVGDKGTTYDENHLDKAYAHIDGGPSNPGYLSAKKEAYACYTRSNYTLTFYYDNLRYSREGTTYDLNEGENAPGWCGEETTYNTDITRVIFDPSFADARPTSTYEWFGAMFNIDHIEGLNYLNTSEVTTMKYMFSDCYGVLTADLSNFDTRKVTDMTAMFAYCLAEELDLSSFSTENVTNMLGMFAYCSSLKTIYVGDSWSTAAVTSSTNMFLDCTSLVGGMGTTYDANHIDASYAHIDGGPSNPGYFTEKGPEAYACYTPSNTTLTFYYDKLRHTRTGTTYDLNTGNNPPAWYNDRIYSSVTRVVFDPSFADARPTSTCEWFILMDKLQSITGMEYLNTSEVTYMLEMFGGCTQFTTLDLSSFNTSKVTSMRGMFDYCIGLTSLNLSNFDTSNVTDMSMMFSSCSNLTSLDVTHFNTANVTNMSSMFHHCTELTEIDVSHFNTANVTSTHNMFNSCSGLTTLDLSSFNTAKVEYMNYMFYNCSNLTSIYVGSGWSTAAVTLSDGMFDDCTRIRGGKGTTYDANHVDASYAHIDGGTSNPGYFTEKAGGQRGDVNGDGSVNISDVTTLIDLLLGGGTISNPAADCNQDSSVNISDVTALIDYLLSGTWN